MGRNNLCPYSTWKWAACSLDCGAACSCCFCSENSRKKTPVIESAKHKQKLSIKQLVFCAMAISLGTVLSKIKLFHFPYGGSITLLSMLVICLPGHFYGLGAGLLAGVAYGVLQLLIDPYVLFPMQAIVDYVLAFGALGLSGLFPMQKMD